MTTAHIKALDLFAGTGWGVACQWLGIKEAGVEIMDEAVATREANGMHTIYRDVWDGLELTQDQHREASGSYGLLIASPPCQTFSLAGKGAGRAALNDVLEAIELHAYKDATALKAFGEKHDPRTALVLTPLAYVWRDRPRLVALEQVPTVLPVWEACAEVMREWGYDVKVEILNAEQYGVPQTRKRAILVARRGGPVHMPIPTHSKYYSTNPSKLDPGVLKWISMAEALGWGDAKGSVAKGVQPNSPMRRLSEPAVTLAFGHDSASFVVVPEGVQHAELKKAKADGTAKRITVQEAAALQSYPTVLRSNYGTGGDPAKRGERRADQPAPTLTSKADRNKWDSETNMTVEETAKLQSYPKYLAASGTSCQVVDPRSTEHPAPTITGSGNAEFGNRPTRAPGPNQRDPEGRRLTTDEAAALQTYPAWVHKRPAPTIVGTRRSEGGMLVGRQLDDGSRRDVGGRQTNVGLRPGMLPGVRVTGEEGATIQSYPHPFVWCGTKTKQFLQIGNAVPPVLAEAVLAALIGIRPGR